MPQFDGAGVPLLSWIVQCAVETLAQLGIELAASVQTMLGRYAMVSDVGA
jgi:hypothetical protein